MSREHLDRARVERFDLLGAAERETALRHAAGCAGCRRLLAADDPTRLFSLLATRPIPPEALDRLSANIHEEIERDGSRVRSGSRRVAWVSVAASLLLGGMIGTYLFTRPGGRPGLEEALLSRPSAAEVISTSAAEAPVGGIRVLSSPGDAQVLDLSVGETQVVMIFDKELEI